MDGFIRNCPCGDQGAVAAASILPDQVEHHPAGEPIDLASVRLRPIHGIVKRPHRCGRKLDVARPFPAGLQGLDVIRVQRERADIRARRSGRKLADPEVPGDPASCPTLRAAFRYAAAEPSMYTAPKT